MRLHGITLRIGLFVAGLAAPALFPSDFLLAQAPPALPIQTGSVAGVVRTAGGAPAAGVRVTAMRADSTDDRLRAMASLTQTDSTGRYVIENVPPGRYYIAAGRVDLPTFYPGTLDMAKGSAVSISSAATISGIDFVIQDSSAALQPANGLRGRGGVPVNVAITNLTDVLNQLGVVAGNNFVAGQRRGPAGTVNPAPAPPGQAGGRGGGAATAFGIAIAPQSNAAWWTNAALVARLGLTDDQKKKIEATFEQYRQTLVQNTRELERQEAILARMLEAEPMEAQKVLSSQIEQVIQARAEMERTNSRMTLDIRQSLTRAQWVQLQAETTQGPGGLGIATPGGRSGGLRSGGPAAPNVVPVTPVAPPAPGR